MLTHSLAPYALAPARFAFPALAGLAGRGALGGVRESALACLVAARLAADALDNSLPATLRAERAAAAKSWMAALTIPPAVRAAVARVTEASGREAPRETASAVEALATAADAMLDPPARAELIRLAGGIVEAGSDSSTERVPSLPVRSSLR